MTPLRRFTSSPEGGRTQWPDKAGSAGALAGTSSVQHPRRFLAMVDPEGLK